MRTIILNIFALALSLTALISCSEDSGTSMGSTSSGLRGDKYIGELTILGEVQEDIIFYVDEFDNSIDILMPGVTFMPGLMPNLEMALIDNPLVSSQPALYYLEESQMVVIYDNLPLINDVIQSIANVTIMRSGYDISVTFDCAISTEAMGDMVVSISYEGVEQEFEDQRLVPQFTLDHSEGFYIASSQEQSRIDGVSATYYQGNSTLVIEGFTFSPMIASTSLPISGLSLSSEIGKSTLSGDSVEVAYSYLSLSVEDLVSGVKCEIIDGACQAEFTITSSVGGTGADDDYFCTFNGDIAINSGSYEQPQEEDYDFSLSYPDGFYAGVNLLEDISVSYYLADNAIVVDGFTLTSGGEGETLSIVGLTEINNGVLRSISGEDVGVIYQGVECAVSALACEIIEDQMAVEFIIEFNAQSYLCTFSGAVELLDSRYSDSQSDAPAFTMDHAAGFYITNSYGDTLLEGVSVSYYEGNNTLVIDGFTFSTALSTTTLPITPLSETEFGGMKSLWGDGIVANYIYMTMDAEGDITSLRCEIIDGEAQLEFSIGASIGGGGAATIYPCTFNGDITIYKDKY